MEKHHLIVLLLADGGVEQIYNGPGANPWKAAGPMAKNGQRSISVRKLRALAEEVSVEKRLPIVRRISLPAGRRTKLAADGAIACFSSNFSSSAWMLIARRS